MNNLLALNLFVFAFIIIALPSPVYAQTPDNIKKAVSRSEKAAQIIAAATDESKAHIPSQLIKNARAIGVFPDVTKVNLLMEDLTVGYGVISRRTATGWSAPAYYAFKGGKIGIRSAGVETPDVILLFMDDKLVDMVAKGRIDFKGEKKAIAGPVFTPPNVLQIEIPKTGIIAYTFKDGELINKGYNSTLFLGGYQLYPDNNMNTNLFRIKAVGVLNVEEIKSNPEVAGVNRFQKQLMDGER